jgi:hypothetical protein
MSTTSRFPRRKAAEEAMNRIHEIFHRTKEEKTVPPSTSLVPRSTNQQKYEGSVLYISHLLNSVEEENTVERKKKHLKKFLWKNLRRMKLWQR